MKMSKMKGKRMHNMLPHNILTISWSTNIQNKKRRTFFSCKSYPRKTGPKSLLVTRTYIVGSKDEPLETPNTICFPQKERREKDCTCLER